MKRLFFDGIPERVLHTFACDCAERALFKEMQLGKELPVSGWYAVLVKRAWLEGKAGVQDIQHAQQAIKYAIQEYQSHYENKQVDHSKVKKEQYTEYNLGMYALLAACWTTELSGQRSAACISQYLQLYAKDRGELYRRHPEVYQKFGMAPNTIQEEVIWQKGHLESLHLGFGFGPVRNRFQQWISSEFNKQQEADEMRKKTWSHHPH